MWSPTTQQEIAILEHDVHALLGFRSHGEGYFCSSSPAQIVDRLAEADSCGVKPNNVMISYTSRPDGVREIDGVCLSDTEDAARVKKGEGIFVQVGNVLWRSPEAH